MKNTKKFIAIMVCAVMLISVLPTNSRSTKATSSVANPKVSKDNSTWDCIYFGSYYQSNSTTKEKIKWRVLSVEGDTAFLLAEYGLDCVPYHNEYTSVTWETCSLRTWLNEDFYNEAFDSSEQAAILETDLVNEDNKTSQVDGGNDTTDKIFLLSLSDVLNTEYGFSKDGFFSSETRLCKPTAYAIEKGCYVSDDEFYPGNCLWGLRTPGGSEYLHADVYSDGYCPETGFSVYDAEYPLAVRPALKVNLAALSWTYGGTIKANIYDGDGVVVDDPTVTPGSDATSEPAMTSIPIITVTKEPTKAPTKAPTKEPTIAPTKEPASTGGEGGITTQTPTVAPTTTSPADSTIKPTEKPAKTSVASTKVTLKKKGGYTCLYRGNKLIAKYKLKKGKLTWKAGKKTKRIKNVKSAGFIKKSNNLIYMTKKGKVCTLTQKGKRKTVVKKGSKKLIKKGKFVTKVKVKVSKKYKNINVSKK